MSRNFNIKNKSFSGFYIKNLNRLIMSSDDDYKIEFYNWEKSKCLPVEVIHISEAIPMEYNFELPIIKFKKHGCYKAAYSVCKEFKDDPDFRYVEGYGLVNGVAVQHAFCKYKDKYFDPIAELILGQTAEIKEYDSIIELTFDQIDSIIKSTGYYGPNIEHYYKMFILNAPIDR